MFNEETITLFPYIFTVENLLEITVSSGDLPGEDRQRAGFAGESGKLNFIVKHVGGEDVYLSAIKLGIDIEDVDLNWNVARATRKGDPIGNIPLYVNGALYPNESKAIKDQCFYLVTRAHAGSNPVPKFQIVVHIHPSYTVSYTRKAKKKRGRDKTVYLSHDASSLLKD